MTIYMLILRFHNFGYAVGTLHRSKVVIDMCSTNLIARMSCVVSLCLNTIFKCNTYNFERIRKQVINNSILSVFFVFVFLFYAFVLNLFEVKPIRIARQSTLPLFLDVWRDTA